MSAWTKLPEARTILADIIRERPEFFIRSGAWIEGGGVRRYRGKTAGKLRALHSRLLDEALKRADRSGDNSEFRALAALMPDDAITAALEAGEQQDRRAA